VRGANVSPRGLEGNRSTILHEAAGQDSSRTIVFKQPWGTLSARMHSSILWRTRKAAIQTSSLKTLAFDAALASKHAYLDESG